MRRILVLCTASLLLAGCVEPDPSSPTPEDLAAVDLSPDHTITVDEDGFRPDTLEIQAGEVIRLVNEGTGVHSFTAEERFDSGRMEPGDETTLLLTEPGTIPYADLEDPDHEGTLTVVEAGPG